MFELFFKYPASLFHKGQFVFLTPWPLWLLPIAILCGAALLFWHVRRNHGMLSGLRPIAIWGLEACMVALILFLLWHPALSIATLRPQQNVVAVLVDDSRSMSLDDASGTREAAAKKVLDSGMLKDLGDKFQVRLYKFGREPERIQKTEQLAGQAPASRIGDTLERVLAESSSLPLGAIVLLSDGADNSGGIDLQTIAAIRRQRIPVHTIGFGRERPERDVEIADAVVAARALPQSKLTASVSLLSYGLAGQKAKMTIRESGKVLATHDVTLRGDGEVQSETVVFNAGEAGPKSLEIGVEPVGGEANAANNKVARQVNVENRKPKILYFEGEPRWEYKFIRRALDDYNDIELAAMVRTTQNKLYRQFPPSMSQKDLEEGFPTKAEDLFQFQGLIIGSALASYFTPAQQQLIHDFVDRRGGGLLFLGGRESLSDGGYPNSPLAELIPTRLPDGKGTFHRDFTSVELTAEGQRNLVTRLDDDPQRNVEKWKKMPQMANYQEVGEEKPGATVLLRSAPQGKRSSPLLVTENFGRGRSVLFATEGSWRWKMWTDHKDKTHATFWQQMFRHLVTDTPGQVTATTPKQVLSDETKVPIRVEVRDKQYKPVTNAKVQARFMGPDGTSATMELNPVPLEEGIYGGEWTAEKPGAYVAEIIAGREQEEVGHDVLSFRREDGVAENFHTAQNRELLEKLAQQTGGRYYKPDEASKLSKEISYSEAGITARETRDLWDMPVIFPARAGDSGVGMAAAAEVGGGMRLASLAGAGGWGLGTGVRLVALALLAFSAQAATYYVTVSGLGGEPDYEQRFKMWADDIDGSLKKAGGDAKVFTLNSPTKEKVKAQFAEIQKQARPEDALVVMLIGHGTFDGVEYKFNIPGADLTGQEIAAMLDRVPSTRQLVVVTTSASGGAIESLRRPNRVVVSATKAGSEKNATIFARFWAEALREPAADTDKNEAVSALEAFRYAQKKTTEFFDTQKRLATEHSVIEDTGKGEGEKDPKPENGAGKLAAAFPVIRIGANAAAARDPNKRPLLDKKEEIENAIDKLKYEKAALPAAEYKKQLTALLVELAKTQEALDK